jgi:hypothetical protein
MYPDEKVPSISARLRDSATVEPHITIARMPKEVFLFTFKDNNFLELHYCRFIPYGINHVYRICLENKKEK